MTYWMVKVRSKGGNWTIRSSNHEEKIARALAQALIDQGIPALALQQAGRMTPPSSKQRPPRIDKAAQRRRADIRSTMNSDKDRF